MSLGNAGFLVLGILGGVLALIGFLDVVLAGNPAS